jgi:hypothetical protein
MKFSCKVFHFSTDIQDDRILHYNNLSNATYRLTEAGKWTMILITTETQENIRDYQPWNSTILSISPASIHTISSSSLK